MLPLSFFLDTVVSLVIVVVDDVVGSAFVVVLKFVVNDVVGAGVVLLGTAK